MWQVVHRQKDIQYASRAASHIARQAQLHRLRHVVRELAKHLPDAALERPDVRELVGYGCSTVMHLVRLAAPRLSDEDHTKDLDFHPDRVRERWRSGLADGRRMLARRPWLEPADPLQGMVVHDLPPEGGTIVPDAAPEASGHSGRG
jgi:NTE family protein